ncbi:MAG: VWA domain-containing protein [Chloroflexota bacterium]
MNRRVVEFITALRAQGVRISVAESIDALRAADVAGVTDRKVFRSALRATLVKEPQDLPTFDKLFPAYFGSDPPPPMMQPGGGMSDEEREQFMQQLMEMLRSMTPEQLRQLFEAMMTGQRMSGQQMRQMLDEHTSLSQLPPNVPGSWALRRAMRELQFDRLQELLEELLEKLREAGVSEEALQQLAEEARQNQQALAQQLAQEAGAGMAQREAEQPRPRPSEEELLDRPFEYMDEEDLAELRPIVTRLAAQLRSRVALRQKRANKGNLDAKSTIRANMRYGAVPLDIRHRRKHLKPRLVIICDRSRSTEQVVRFLLQLIYTLQDVVSRTRSFAFIDTIYDISSYFNEARPEQAIEQVLQNVYPKRSYSTDLGQSLADLMRDHAGCIDHRTTVVVLGDARNNENDPRLDVFEQIKRRSHKIVWFNPEAPHMWGQYDPGSLSSDMLKYMPLCDSVHHVSNLRQLVAAVDSLFVR